MNDWTQTEGKAYRSSGVWFLAALGTIAAGVAIVALGVDIVGGIVCIAGVLLLFFAMHKHDKAGGDTSTSLIGIGDSD